jgi:hypothetical protein
MPVTPGLDRMQPSNCWRAASPAAPGESVRGRAAALMTWASFRGCSRSAGAARVSGAERATDVGAATRIPSADNGPRLD